MPNRQKSHRKSFTPKRSGKTGLPAGSLVHLGERKIEHAAIKLIEYDNDTIKETYFASLSECRACAPTLPKFWLNVHGLHEPEVMQEIGKRFQLHPLVLEDILNTNQRPKVEDYGSYLFLVARLFNYDPDTLSIATEQVSFVIGQNYVLTFQECPSGNFDPIRAWLHSDKGRIR